MADLVDKLRFVASGQDDVQSEALTAAADEIERLRQLVQAFAGKVQDLAFEMPPPNAYTPRFAMLAHAARVEMLNGTEGPNV